MNHSEIHDFCCKCMGQRVVITEKCGRRHVGHITRVDRDMVWIMPDRDRDCGGYGIGYWGFGRERFGIGIAIGAIAGIVLASAFFW